MTVHTRRSILKLMATSALVYGGLAIVPTRVTAAVDPGTALLVLNTAKSFLSFMNSGGPSVAELIIAQTEIIAELSAKIDIIDAKLNEIFLKLDEIDENLLSVPDRVLIVGLEVEISAIFTQYAEILQAHSKNRQKPGASAQEIFDFELEMIEEMKFLRKRIISARTQIMQRSSWFITPLLAGLIRVEVETMIFIGISNSRIASALNSYNRWLSVNIFNEKSRKGCIKKSIDENNDSISSLSSAYWIQEPTIRPFSCLKEQRSATLREGKVVFTRVNGTHRQIVRKARSQALQDDILGAFSLFEERGATIFNGTDIELQRHMEMMLVETEIIDTQFDHDDSSEIAGHIEFTKKIFDEMNALNEAGFTGICDTSDRANDADFFEQSDLALEAEQALQNLVFDGFALNSLSFAASDMRDYIAKNLQLLE